jgi:hypothetical protein
MGQATARDRADDRMPAWEAANLRRHYAGLPTVRVKWRCPEGQAFLGELGRARSEYGTSAVAEALDVSIQGVHYMLSQRQPGPDAALTMPSEQVVRAVKRAHLHVVEMRLSGRQVRRGTRQYRDLHLALVRTMAAGWPLTVIAQAARVPVRELRRFENPPTIESLQVLLLEDLQGAWERHLQTTSRSQREATGRLFLQLLKETDDLGVTRLRVANRLKMTQERVGQLMSVGMAGLRKIES